MYELFCCGAKHWFAIYCSLSEAVGGLLPNTWTVGSLILNHMNRRKFLWSSLTRNLRNVCSMSVVTPICSRQKRIRTLSKLLVRSSPVNNTSLKVTPRCLVLESNTTLTLFTQRLRIISGVVVRQFSANGDSHKANHHKPPCNSHRKPAPQLQKRCEGTHHVDDVGVSQVFPQLI